MFLAPNLECFTQYDAFCSHTFDYACLRRLRHIVMKRFEITQKLYSSKALLKMAGGGDAFPTSDPPGSAPAFSTYVENVRTKCIIFGEALTSSVKKFIRHLSENYLKITKITIPAVSSVAKRTLSVREVWGSTPGPVKSTQCRQQLATVATFLRSCVAQALSRGDGLRNSLHASA